MRYSGSTPSSRKEMLAFLGLENEEQLLVTVPDDVRVRDELDIDGPLPESDLLRRLESMKTGRPRHALVGAGLYQHFVPATVDSLAARSEWVTSYTPYQAELAQGTLAMYYEFQTYIAMLTGQEIANGGMYDGSTALAEAVLMAMRVRPRHDPVVFVSEALHPEYLAVLRTYMGFVDIEVKTMPIDPETGRTRIDLTEATQQKAAAVVLQSPNYLGVVEDASMLHPKAMSIGVCTEALSHAWLAPMPVKIAVGECQSFGIPMQLGGPTAGYFATGKQWVRKTPGRLVGRTVDDRGNEAFCITLATREQFIRREKATSNICTSSGLMCLRATIYLSLLGRKGLENLAEKNTKTAHYLARGLADLGLPTAFDGSFFNEFVVDASRHPNLHERLLERDIVLGVPLPANFGRDNHFLVAATEIHHADAPAILEEIATLVRDS